MPSDDRQERSISADGASRRRKHDYSESSEDDRQQRRYRRRDSDDDRPRTHDRGVQAASDNASRSRRHRDMRDRLPDEHFRRERRHRERSRSGHRHRSRSPPAKKRRRSPSVSQSPPRRSRAPLPSQDESFRGERRVEGKEAAPEKQKPNYKPTGLLAKEANTVSGTTTVLKYHEPPEARKSPPKEQWRMYVFKKEDLLDTIYLHQRSVWLFGRDQKVTDMLLEHPSISKQHAVIQFRYITSTNEYGDKMSKVKPYLIDLESANGSKLNGKRVEASRFVELVDGDVVAFGDSEREYVLMLPSPDA